MKKFLISLSLIIPLLAQAQFNPEAIDIIRPVSEDILSSSGIKIDFTFTFLNKQEDIEETHEGTAYLKGNKYKLNLLDITSYFNGSSQWVHMLEEEEVSITEPDIEDEEEFTPVNIFSMYEKGFRFKIIEEAGAIVVIDMIPDDTTKPFHKIRIKLDKANKTFLMVKSFGRDGVDNIIDIKSTEKGLNLADDYFVFNTTNFPNTEVIDMR